MIKIKSEMKLCVEYREIRPISNAEELKVSEFKDSESSPPLYFTSDIYISL